MPRLLSIRLWNSLQHYLRSAFPWQRGPSVRGIRSLRLLVVIAGRGSRESLRDRYMRFHDFAGPLFSPGRLVLHPVYSTSLPERAYTICT